MTFKTPNNLGNLNDLYKTTPVGDWFMIDYLKAIFVECSGYRMFYPFCSIEEKNAGYVIHADVFPMNTMAEDFLRGHSIPYQRISLTKQTESNERLLKAVDLMCLLENRNTTIVSLLGHFRKIDVDSFDMISISNSAEVVADIKPVDEHYKNMLPLSYFNSMSTVQNDHSLFFDSESLYSKEEWRFKNMRISFESNISNLEIQAFSVLRDRIKDFRFI